MAGGRINPGQRGVTPSAHDGRVMESITGTPTPGGCTMPLTTVPVSLPSVRPRLGAVPAESFTIDCADCMHQHTRSVTTAWSRSSSTASRRTPSWSMPRRPAPCAYSSRPGWSPAYATPATWADSGVGGSVGRTIGLPPCEHGACPEQRSPPHPQPTGPPEDADLSRAVLTIGREAGLAVGRGHHGRGLRRHPSGPARAQAARTARHHAVHLPQPGTFHRPGPHPPRGPLVGGGRVELPPSGQRHDD